MKIATAFSGGFGSIELAMKYENIEHEVVFACEWAEPQRKSYLLNHGEPTSKFYKDIRDLDGTKYKGGIDILHLSPPCQSYSLSGKRGGAYDERGALMFEAIRLIDEVQPKMFSIENVKGLLSSNNGEDWKNIMLDLKKLNYSISWGIINAREQGTPQNRERVFIVGFRADAGMMPFPPKTSLTKKLKDVLDDVVDDKYYLTDKMISYLSTAKIATKKYDGSQEYAPTMMGVYYKMPTDGFYIKVPSATKQGYELAKDGDSINLTFPNSKTRRGRVGKQVAQTLDTACNQGTLIQVADLSDGKNKQGYRVYDTNGIASTQNAKGGGMGAKTGLYQVGYRIRRLTPREVSRVQGDFQDMFKFGDASDTKLYEFIGNAMDISTTRNLLKTMIKFSEKLTFNPPKEPTFTRREDSVQLSLF